MRNLVLFILGVFIKVLEILSVLICLPLVLAFMLVKAVEVLFTATLTLLYDSVKRNSPPLP